MAFSENVRRFPLSLTGGRHLQYLPSTEETQLGRERQYVNNRHSQEMRTNHQHLSNSETPSRNRENNVHTTGHYIISPTGLPISTISQSINQSVINSHITNRQMFNRTEDDDTLPSYTEAVKLEMGSNS